MQLSSNEQAVLDQLKLNSRLTSTEISRKLNIARTTVNQIITRLEEKIIDNYSVTLKEDVLMSSVNCYVLINSDPKNHETLGKLEKIPEINALKSVAGRTDLIPIVHTDTHQKLDDLLVKIARIDGILNTETLILLSSKFTR